MHNLKFISQQITTLDRDYWVHIRYERKTILGFQTPMWEKIEEIEFSSATAVATYMKVYHTDAQRPANFQWEVLPRKVTT